mmetsp:Transcript_16595/g.68067  ORF Transcript_16595/g.68067 Transcript_16595/m.68067 type:complete len:83 (+) Transcript_16595:496-744(+)
MVSENLFRLSAGLKSVEGWRMWFSRIPTCGFLSRFLANDVHNDAGLGCGRNLLADRRSTRRLEMSTGLRLRKIPDAETVQGS